MGLLGRDWRRFQMPPHRTYVKRDRDGWWWWFCRNSDCWGLGYGQCWDRVHANARRHAEGVT